MWINAVIFMIFANVSHDFCHFYRDFLLSLLIRNKPARLIQHWDAQKWQQQHACIDFQFLSSFDHVRNPVARITDPDDRRQCHAPLSCSAKRRANQWRQCCLLVGVRQDYAVILCRLTQHPQCIKSVHNLSQWEPEIIIIIRWHALRTNISSQMSPSGGKGGTSIYDQPINIRHTDVHCASFDVWVRDLDHHKETALSLRCIWHMGTTQDLEDTVCSPCVKCGSQKNHRPYCSQLTSRGPPPSPCSVNPTSTARLEATSRKTWPHLAPCNRGRPWPSELWPRDCLEKCHYSRRMATYCGHSNAPVEYALKERRININQLTVPCVYRNTTGTHAFTFTGRTVCSSPQTICAIQMLGSVSFNGI